MNNKKVRRGEGYKGIREVMEEVVWCETGVLHSPQVGKTSGLGLFLQ